MTGEAAGRRPADRHILGRTFRRMELRRLGVLLSRLDRKSRYWDGVIADAEVRLAAIDTERRATWAAINRLEDTDARELDAMAAGSQSTETSVVRPRTGQTGGLA